MFDSVLPETREGGSACRFDIEADESVAPVAGYDHVACCSEVCRQTFIDSTSRYGRWVLDRAVTTIALEL